MQLRPIGFVQIFDEVHFVSAIQIFKIEPLAAFNKLHFLNLQFGYRWFSRFGALIVISTNVANGHSS